MNEEIKKILKGLKNISTPTGISYSGDITINNDDVKILEDYITNLQQEIERLNNIIDNARKYIENNQSGCENENGHFHLNFDGDIWELYEMLRRF